jgi:hypothetical protein
MLMNTSSVHGKITNSLMDDDAQSQFGPLFAMHIFWPCHGHMHKRSHMVCV